MDIDFLLLQRMKRGDENAFDVFVRKYYKEILNYCNYHCPDTSTAEDLTQETFLRFFEKLSYYRYMGKTKKSAMPSRHTLVLPTSCLLNRLTIKAALDRLPAELREVIILYYFQELKLTEISSTLQIGLPLVKYRVKQAKTHLERLLREE